MRKIIAAMKLSLDTRFQGPGGYADWVDGWSEDYGLAAEIDACLMGGQMYQGYERYWSALRADPRAASPMTGTVPTAGEIAWAERIAALPHFVLSRSPGAASWPGTRFLHSLEEVAALKAEPGRAIYLMGGGSLVRILIAAGLVDELRLITYPVVAGGPYALFAPDEAPRLMELVAAQGLPGGLVRSRYRLCNAAAPAGAAAAA